jgi:hypothetical protein
MTAVDLFVLGWFGLMAIGYSTPAVDDSLTERQ